MDVKLIANVLHHGEVLRTGSLLTVEDDLAKDWIERGLAEAPVAAVKPAHVQMDEPKPVAPVAKKPAVKKAKRK